MAMHELPAAPAERRPSVGHGPGGIQVGRPLFARITITKRPAPRPPGGCLSFHLIPIPRQSPILTWEALSAVLVILNSNYKNPNHA